MKHTTTDGGVGSGDGRDQPEVRGRRSLKSVWVKDAFNLSARPFSRWDCGAASRAVVELGGWPAPHPWRRAFLAGVLKGRRHRHLDKRVGLVSTSVALERWCWSKPQGTAGRSSQSRDLAAVKDVSDDAEGRLAARSR